MSSKSRQSKACTLALIAFTLILTTVLILICIFYQTFIVNLTLSATAIQSHSSSFVSEVTKLSRDVINKSYDIIATTLNNTSVYSFLEISEELYPADIDGTIYTIVLVIQITTVVLRQHHLHSIVLSLLSYTVYKFSYLAPGVYHLYYKVLRYCLLALSVLLVFTTKTTVVTVSQRKNTPKPVIKVRRSPKKRESSPLAPSSAMFSEDEDSKPTSRAGESPANLSLLFNSPANQSGVFGSRGTLTANQPPGTPLKDVSNKFDFMKISGSPVKCRPTKHSAERTPNTTRRHVACLKPARFSLDRPADLPPQEQPDPLEDVRPRFDSTCSEEEEKTEEEGVIVNDALPLKPIILVLVVSVVTNYYLFVNYVLVS
ncbi:uncharacterized protein LOC134813990 [Bolinopsis microptera]|uniref:uncharacterized protein LOC134813990 n=1 Tax=Bolinopsis microptera TaxID=2820187 RepID=UPI003078EEF0